MSARWTYTLNNYTPEEGIALAEVECKYHICGKEVAPTTGTPHLQGYIILNRQQRLSYMKKLNSRCHWEVAKGNTEQNITYCSKCDDFMEFGERPKTPVEKGQMEKDRWKAIISHAKAGTLEEHDPKMYYLHFNTNNRLQAQFQEPKFIEKKIRVYWGPTATGKSHKAWTEAGPSAYGKDPRSKFWYGYHGQTNVIIDEFRGGIDISHLLRWLDKYPLLVEVKGSSCACAAENIWITSNLHPNAWYPDLDAATVEALCRRLEIVEFKVMKTSM